MAINCKRWLPPTAILLALGSPLAWGQPAEQLTKTWQELEGAWCDAERGCTHWWTQYTVLVRTEKIIIHYRRDGRLFIFVGNLRDEIPKWTITGTITSKEGDKEIKKEFNGVVNEFEATKGTIEAQVTGKLKTRVVGTQVDVTVPFKMASDTVIIGTFEEEREAKDGQEEDDERGKKNKIGGKVKGKIEGKLKNGAGQDGATLQGEFEGKFKGKLTVPIDGFYIVPPFHCSEAGRELSSEEWKLREEAVKADRAGRLEARPGRFLSNKEREQRKAAEKLREEKAKALIKEPLTAESQKTDVTELAGFHTQGRFMRKVKASVSMTAPQTITLELPPLPVLDDACVIRDEVGKRTLKLVKQHDAAK